MNSFNDIFYDSQGLELKVFFSLISNCQFIGITKHKEEF